MKNPNVEAFKAGSVKGRLKIKDVLGMSVYKSVLFYQEFFKNVFDLQIDYSDSMIMIVDSRKYLPIFVPANFLSSVNEPKGGASDSFAHAYVALTLAFEEPLICELGEIDAIPLKNKLLTAREGFIFLNFFKWLTGEELNPKHILLTSSFYKGGKRAGVYFDNNVGYSKVSSDLERLVSCDGYRTCYRFEKSG